MATDEKILRVRRYRNPIGSDERRRRLRAAALALLVLGVAAIGVGLLAPSLSGDTTPRALPAGAVTALPPAGIFGGTVVLYGRVDDAAPPPVDRLGCVLLGPQGVAASGSLSAGGLDGFDRIVIDGVALRPLLRVAGDAAEMRCDGPSVAALAPLVVRAQRGVDDMVPMAAFSLASLSVVVGLAGLFSLRPDAQ
jgi:hypothetical protein